MEVKTKLKSIRCGVSVHLSTVSSPPTFSCTAIFRTQVEWHDGAGVSVALDEPSVFVRACVLGQLQHSHLHTPTFPLTLNQTLSFDRVRCVLYCCCRGSACTVGRGHHYEVG